MGKKVMVTGHRLERLASRGNEVGQWIDEQLKELCPSEAITGMVAGVDQIFAHHALGLNIPLVCVYPYRRKMCEEERYINNLAASVIFHNDKYSKECYTQRDFYMVDRADIVLVVWDGKPWGGSYVTAQYAEQQNKEVRYFPWKA